MKNYGEAFILGSLGGWIFSLIHLPLPWTLGPLVSITIAKYSFKRQVYWSAQIRNIAMAILGYSMGRSFTPETGQHILTLLPILLIVSIISVMISALGGIMMSRYARVNLATTLLGSLPAGLSQMASISENIEGANVSAITLMQTVRVLTVVFVVPFIALNGLARAGIKPITPTFTDIGFHEILILTLYSGVIALIIYLAKYVKLPGRYIVSPIISTATLVLLGINSPALPQPVIKVAQICVGIQMGRTIDISSIDNWKEIVVSSLVSVLGTITILFGLDYILAQMVQVSLVTAFIGTAPGGMTEMGLTAMMVHADLPTVVTFQLFRLLFVLLIAIPVMKWWLNCSKKLCNQGKEMRTKVKDL